MNNFIFNLKKNNINTSFSKFRADINGLRAWAVIAVTLYHFGVPGFDGGFSGVDLFFVISGFLMTGIIVVGLEKNPGGFSIRSFYLARARRIFPALIALCIVLLVMGFFYLAMPDYRLLGSHAFATIAFLSNLKFLAESGYFDSSSHEKWLLHTWSLSVEWQFYIILPLILVALWKIRPGKKPAIILLAAGFVASLALSILITPGKPSFAFYLLPTRAWEMLAGGLIYFLQIKYSFTPKQRMSLELSGFLIIISCIFLFNGSMQWPGWLALIPVIGASLVLLAARSHSAWTDNVVAQWFGDRSYSLYLWHWPVVVALTYLNQQTSLWAICMGIGAALVLACLSYELVEKPARQKMVQYSSRKGIAVLATFCLLVALPSIFIRHSNGITGRFTEATDIAAEESFNKNPRQSECTLQNGSESPNCIFGGKQVKAILLGDSHANATITALQAALPSKDAGILNWTYNGCPTLFGFKPVLKQGGVECSEFLERTKRKIDNYSKEIPLVIINRTSVYLLGFNEPWESEKKPLIYFTKQHQSPDAEFRKEFSQKLVDSTCFFAKTRTVYLVRPIPEMGVDIPKAMSRAMILKEKYDPSISLESYHQRHQLVWAAQDAAKAQCGAKILDPLPYLCRDGRCFGSKNGRPLYFDDDHLSEYGNKLLTPMFKEIFAGNPQQSR